ncbi:MAG: RNA-binding S4 domain-containing protein [Rhodospirillales bacterium]|jgi:ribosome-associated heat shock protein Hsp15
MSQSDTQRLDAWLWKARFFKTRAISTAMISKGRVRINGDRVQKPSRQIRPGDVLTFPQGNYVRVIRVLGFAERRGPAKESVYLYEHICETS